MSISKHLDTWVGRPVVNFDPETGLSDPENTLYRLSVDFDEDTAWGEALAAFLAAPRASEVTGIVVGNWDPGYEQMDSSSVVEALSGAADRLPRLSVLFLGDITYDENEISWINQSDLAPLFNAFPQLEHLGIRGGNNLSLGRPQLPHLKTLLIESGGLPSQVVAEVVAADLPSLEHLEIWLGSENYGGDTTIEDLAPILNGADRWPKLTYLGLRDSEFTDAIAEAIATAPILKQLKTLDLSLGTLGNDGAAALAASPAVAGLEKLDIQHHYVAPEFVDKLRALGITVEAGDPQKPDDWDGKEHRYIAHSE